MAQSEEAAGEIDELEDARDEAAAAASEALRARLEEMAEQQRGRSVSVSGKGGPALFSIDGDCLRLAVATLPSASGEVGFSVTAGRTDITVSGEDWRYWVSLPSDNNLAEGEVCHFAAKYEQMSRLAAIRPWNASKAGIHKTDPHRPRAPAEKQTPFIYDFTFSPISEELVVVHDRTTIRLPAATAAEPPISLGVPDRSQEFGSTPVRMALNALCAFAPERNQPVAEQFQRVWLSHDTAQGGTHMRWCVVNLKYPCGISLCLTWPTARKIKSALARMNRGKVTLEQRGENNVITDGVVSFSFRQVQGNAPDFPLAPHRSLAASFPLAGEENVSRLFAADLYDKPRPTLPLGVAIEDGAELRLTLPVDKIVRGGVIVVKATDPDVGAASGPEEPVALNVALPTFLRAVRKRPGNDVALEIWLGEKRGPALVVRGEDEELVYRVILSALSDQGTSRDKGRGRP
ncbi:hypothetical protein ACO2Q3_19870 [Caulobacter sp. KR2-114]|uniref:hypothetical protein n=1 Tax=Caulobacter sp. KR2-114 TaxID=3400912 RepID=UPI003BFAA1E3